VSSGWTATGDCRRASSPGARWRRPPPAAVGERVGDRVERVGLLALLDLEVGDRRAAAGVPVDEVVVAVDAAALEQRDEDAHDGVGVGAVEREALVLVVAGGAEPLVLLDDRRAVLLAPAPGRARRRPRGRAPRASCPRDQLALDLRLGRDAGVIGAEDPLRALARACARWRISASWIAPPNACPMCSAPVTFGGGIAIE
jgi:hypothetical protein